MFRKVFIVLALVCTVFCSTQEHQLIEREKVSLVAPDLSEENYMGAFVGIRPYRKSGVRIEREGLGDKVIVHNYGYGGSGLTLCFGGAKEVVDLIRGREREEIAVLGAGVAGLSVAYELVSLGYRVTVYADQFSPNLTSDVAAGIWSPPSTKNLSEDKKAMLDRMLEVSTARYAKVASSGEPEFLGVSYITDYNFKQEETKSVDKFTSLFDSGFKDVVVTFDNGLEKTGKEKKILALRGDVFMKDLFAKVKAKGCKIVERRFTSKEEILDLQEGTVINCTSLGSEKLFGDTDFIPIRGHILRFKNTSNLEYMAFESVPYKDIIMWITLYPYGEELLVSGSWEEGVSDKSIDSEIEGKLLKYVRERFDPRTLEKE